MTVFTSAQHLGVIHRDQRQPGRVGMAGLAQVRGTEVIGAFTRAIYPIVTSAARGGNASMIKADIHPPGDHVAGITGLGGDDVGRPFTGGDNAVVTAFASSNDFAVIHCGGWYPRRRDMTSLAIVGGIDVSARLTGGNNAIVTRPASTQHLIMIHGIDRRPRGGGNMTRRTHISAINMRGTFPAGDNAVVTGNTTTQHLCVVYRHYWNPGSAAVAGLTDVRSVDVGSIFSGGDGAIVTTHARAQNLCMIDPGRRDPIEGVMTGLANGC